mgnify:CR=1 FL=1
MTLEKLRDYKVRMFNEMTLEQAINAHGFIPALYQTEASIVGKLLNPKCGLCEDTGVYPRQDGPDDYVDVKCLCQRSEEDGDGIDD